MSIKVHIAHISAKIDCVSNSNSIFSLIKHEVCKQMPAK
jgi:hypothetical protein